MTIPLDEFTRRNGIPPLIKYLQSKESMGMLKHFQLYQLMNGRHTYRIYGIHPGTWKKILKPEVRRLVQLVKSNTYPQTNLVILECNSN